MEQVTELNCYATKTQVVKKFLIASICFIVLCQQLPAQVKYDTCQYVHQFDGEWMYTNERDTIRVCLRAHRAFDAELNSIDDVIYGWHEYKRGDSVIESTYQNRFMPIDVDTITKRSVSIGLMMLSGEGCVPGNRRASGSINDYLNANETKIVTVNLDITRTIMTLHQRHSAGYGVFTGATGMTLPQEFILVKQ